MKQEAETGSDWFGTTGSWEVSQLRGREGGLPGRGLGGRTGGFGGVHEAWLHFLLWFPGELQQTLHLHREVGSGLWAQGGHTGNKD